MQTWRFGCYRETSNVMQMSAKATDVKVRTKKMRGIFFTDLTHRKTVFYPY